ncbi:hypothetical protein ABY69_02914 [Listeria monocytogenes]|nr:hypothetical protein ABY69_02914 [Listeria monocytogenes]
MRLILHSLKSCLNFYPTSTIHDRGVKGQKETISSMQGYLMRTILSELEERYSADMRRQNMAKYNIFNQ